MRTDKIKGRRFTLVSLLLILQPAVDATTTTNLTHQYRLCKPQSCITHIQETYNLTLVTATPTHAAFQPGWPETLYTLSLCIISLFSAFATISPGPKELFIRVIVPFGLMLQWLVAWGYALKNAATGGWVAVNLFTGWLNVLAIIECQHFMGPFTTLIAVFQVLAFKVQFLGSVYLVAQRWQGLGSIAYNITDAHGCVPYHGRHHGNATSYFESDFKDLQGGARSDVFRAIQTAQMAWSYTVFMGLACAMGYRKMSDEGYAAVTRLGAAASILLMSIPILIYEAVIAAKGAPVVLSGNCMLVELDPRWGFWDSKIDNWWKVISSLGGM